MPAETYIYLKSFKFHLIFIPFLPVLFFALVFAVNLYGMTEFVYTFGKIW